MEVAPPIVEAPGMPPLTPLEKIPYPLPVRILAGITLLAFILGLARSPHAITIGIEAERGAKALESGQAAAATGHLSKVVKEFPEAKDTRIDLAEAQIKSGNMQDAFTNLIWFEGKKVSKEQEDRLNALQGNFEAIMDAEEKKSKGAGE